MNNTTVITLPPPAIGFFDSIEVVLYYSNQIEDFQEILQIFNQKKELFISFLTELEEKINEEWEFAKATLPIEKNFIEEKEKYLSLIKEKLEETIQKVQDLNLGEENIEYSKIEEISKNLILDLVNIFETYNRIQELLSNQKLVSPFPVIDRFLKLFWVYVENIKNLNNLPVNLLIKSLFGSFNFIENFDKQLEIEKKIIELLKDNEKIIKLIEEQKSFIEAIKYALGASYSLINGEIDLSSNPDLPQKIFIQINQASNMIFVLQKNKKLDTIQMSEKILENFDTLPEDLKNFSIEFLKNVFSSFLTNPSFIANIEKGYLTKIEFIFEFLNSPYPENLIRENKENFIDFIKIISKTNLSLDNVQVENLVNLTQVEKELLNAFLLFLNNNLPTSTFVNILINLKNTITLYFFLDNQENFNKNKMISIIEDTIYYSFRYLLNTEYFISIYTNFIDFFSEFKILNKEIEKVLNSKIICPSCKQENDFFNTKCNNCNFRFSVSPKKLLMINLYHSPFIIQNYIFKLIENYFVKNDKENTLAQLSYTIEELKNVEKMVNEISQKEKIETLINFLEDIQKEVENDQDQEIIVEKILKIIDYSNNTDIFSSNYQY